MYVVLSRGQGNLGHLGNHTAHREAIALDGQVIPMQERIHSNAIVVPVSHPDSVSATQVGCRNSTKYQLTLRVRARHSRRGTQAVKVTKCQGPTRVVF